MRHTPLLWICPSVGLYTITPDRLDLNTRNLCSIFFGELETKLLVSILYWIIELCDAYTSLLNVLKQSVIAVELRDKKKFQDNFFLFYHHFKNADI